MGSISDINARKAAEGQTGFFRYTWDDVKELAEHDGYSTAFCPVCGDLCIGQPGSDAIFDGWAQRANRLHREGLCLEVLVFGTQW